MGEQRGRVLPLVRAGLLGEQVGREWVVFDTETNEAHCLAPLAGAVFAHCDGRTSVEDLPVLVSLTLGEAVSGDEVVFALGQLQDAGLLEPSAEAATNLTRRRFLQGTVATVGAGALITTMATPAAAQVSDRQCGTGLRCVTQSAGDDFCGCTNVCSGEGTSDGGTKCNGFGLGSVIYFDSCECMKCPSTSDSNHEFGDLNDPDNVLRTFIQFCPSAAEADQPCSQYGGTSGHAGYQNGGCLDGTKKMDGICVPQSGDSTERCA